MPDGVQKSFPADLLSMIHLLLAVAHARGYLHYFGSKVAQQALGWLRREISGCVQKARAALRGTLVPAGAEY